MRKFHNKPKDSFVPLVYSSIEELIVNASVVFVDSTTSVFRDDIDIVPVTLSDGTKYVPWGGDNNMPYHILDLIEKDETLSTCQLFNAEVCYGSGLQYNSEACNASVKNEIDDFILNNDIASYFLGVCQDFKHFGWCVSLIILDAEGRKIVDLHRKEVCYCRFSPANDKGKIEYVLYANWKKASLSSDDIEKIPLLDIYHPWRDLSQRMGLDSSTKKPKGSCRKFALVSRIPTPDSTYYPIPYYASLFKGKWYNIKQLIGLAKEAKLKNSAPIKYQIEVSNKYWDNIFKREGITDRKKMQERIIEEKHKIIDFLTGAENSGKALFSTFYTTPNGEEMHDVVIKKIDSETKEGGDWSTDIQEAVNMFCFTMRVHSNLVGSVPGKSQSNNSGSDKRELYTIAQALQKPYHDILFLVHRIIIKFNNWRDAYPECPFIQLTTLDENKDAKVVDIAPKKKE